MGQIDIIVMVVLLISIGFALYRGLACELVAISGWILAGFGALYSYSWVQPIMNKLITDPTLAGIVGSAFIALIILIIITLVNSKITHHLRKSPLNGLDRLLGFFFGIFRAVLVIAFVYLLGDTLIFSSEQIKRWGKENYSLTYIQKSAKILEDFIPKNIQKDMRFYTQERQKDLGKIEKSSEDAKKENKKEIPNEENYSKDNRKKLDNLIKETVTIEDL